MPFNSFDTAAQFVAAIDITTVEPPAYSRWISVTRQAIRHTRGVHPGQLLERQRPNESQHILDYRVSNYRAITQEGTIKFNDKASRIISESRYTLTTASDDLREWIKETPFNIGNGEQANFNEYFIKLVLPCSFEDPNALLVSFPYNPENPGVPPAFPVEDGGLLPNESVGIKSLIVSSKWVKWIDTDLFAWEADYNWTYLSQKGEQRTAPFYFICDKESYYRYIPIREGKGNRGDKPIIYELQTWYVHDTGLGDEHELPLNVLGGTLIKDTGDDTITYNESFLKAYFVLCDEVIGTFSDYQAAKIRTAYPVPIMSPQPCPNSDCMDGRVKVMGENGHELHTCGTCNGEGTIKDLGPFSTLIREQGQGFDNKGDMGPILEYVSPPLDSAKFLKQDYRDLLADAKMSINLDLLESTVESGEAKKVRLQDLHDMLMKISGNLFDVMERFLWYTECLLHPNREERVIPVITKPISFDIKNEQVLAMDAKSSHPADAVTSLIEFYRRKYAGNDRLIRIKELALAYSPLLAITDPKELQIRLLGAYDQNDLIRRDRAEFAMNQIANELGDDFFELSPQEAFLRANIIINPFLPPSQDPIMP